MTKKNKALSLLAQLALKYESEHPAKEIEPVSNLIADALADDLPAIAQIARHHAALHRELTIHSDKLDETLLLASSDQI